MSRWPHAPLRLERGLFLVASPSLDTPLFERGVVLICEHSITGSYGLLVNKPIEVELPEEILDLERARNEHVGLRAGGPLKPEQLMLLHTGQAPCDHCLPLLPGVVLGGDLGFLQSQLEHSDQPPLLLCFGYCAWGPGQLEREILDGEWHMADATAEDLFELPPQELWAKLLRHQGGRHAVLASLPHDLSLN
jgi:putative transcriptional regulator